MARMHLRPEPLPLWAPPCLLRTRGTGIAPLYDDVFLRRLYESPAPMPHAPRIVDAGGHLGLASLYFVTRYPDCQLTVIEANPHLAELLRINLAAWASRVEILEAALSTQDGELEFHVKRDNLLAVTGAIESRERAGLEMSTFKVKSLDARSVLSEPVDLMKLDVEGHEYQLLRLPQFEPGLVKRLIVEFHDVDRRRAEFEEVTTLLIAQRGYRVASDENVALGLPQVHQLEGCPVLKLY